MADPRNEPTGHLSGWSVDEDPEGGFRWRAFGPAGTVQGQAPAPQAAIATGRPAAVCSRAVTAAQPLGGAAAAGE